MSTARGDYAALVSRLQSTFGTAESAGNGDFYKLPFYELTSSPTEEMENDESLYGDAFPGDAVAGLRNLSGSLVVPLGLSSIGWHLRALLGEPATTGTTDYTHVFETAAQPSVPLLTQGISYTDIDQHFVQDSVAYTGLEISAQKTGPRQRATFNIVGREEAKLGAALDTTPLEYLPESVPNGFKAKLLIDGVEAAGATGVTLTLGSGVEPDQETLNGPAHRRRDGLGSVGPYRVSRPAVQRHDLLRPGERRDSVQARARLHDLVHAGSGVRGAVGAARADRLSDQRAGHHHVELQFPHQSPCGG